MTAYSTPNLIFPIKNRKDKQFATIRVEGAAAIMAVQNQDGKVKMLRVRQSGMQRMSLSLQLTGVEFLPISINI